ncbi:MAG TPA: hypothetical protein VF042_02715 [Gemmatimonadaceae bacterium]
MSRFYSLILLTALGAVTAAAQQPSIEIRADYSRGTQTHTDAWGGGGSLQLTWGSTSAPIQINTSVSGDYLKQGDGGPGTAMLGYDLTAQPGGNMTLKPYAGGGASLNWSTGDNKSWEDAKAGYDVIGGLLLHLSSLPSMQWKVEERFGYINREEHTLQTRLGVIFSL